MMHGTHNYPRYRRMALSLLGGLCFAATHLPAVAANQVNVTVNPTTGYFESGPRTIRVPPTVTMSPIKDVSAVVVEKMPGGGLAQSISSGIEITASRQSAPVGVKLRVGLNAVRGAATRCFTSLRCNVALSAGASGLQALLDGVGWVMTEGSELRKPSSYPLDYGSGDITFAVPAMNAHCGYFDGNDHVFLYGKVPTSSGRCDIKYCPKSDLRSGVRRTLSGYSVTPTGMQCFYGGGAFNPEYSPRLATPAEISDLFSSYIPDPSDLPWFSPAIDLSASDVELDITDPPSFREHVGTKTIYDAAGNPVEVQETNIWHDFAPVDNPGKEPGLKDVETQKVDRYGPGGEPIGSTTTIVTRPPGSSQVPPTESPVDCDLMPTLCKWLDWTQDGWEEPEDPDLEGLRQVIDLREYGESVVIGPGLMVCPEPLALYVPYLDVEVGISYQPFCDLADLLNPLLIALAYFGGAVLLVRSI